MSDFAVCLRTHNPDEAQVCDVAKADNTVEQSPAVKICSQANLPGQIDCQPFGQIVAGPKFAELSP